MIPNATKPGGANQTRNRAADPSFVNLRIFVSAAKLCGTDGSMIETVIQFR
jgi:hypothetical protein